MSNQPGKNSEQLRADLRTRLDERHREHRERLREAEAALVARGIDTEEICETVSQAIGWFDDSAIAVTADPDDFCAAYDTELWEQTIAALRGAGFDLDDPAVFDIAWEDFYESSQDADSWVGSLMRDQQRRVATRMAILTAKASRPSPTSPICAPRSRSRQSRGRPTRTRGSRRVASRSAGGGSSGDDDSGGDPPEPPTLGELHANAPLGVLGLRDTRGRR